MKKASRTVASLFGRLFHTRSIIIISPHRTKHLSVTGSFQFMMLAAVAACVGWASYSTGSYMAARDVLQQRDETIKSVANARVDTSYGYLTGNAPSARPGPASAQPNIAAIAQLTDPSFALATMDHEKLYARIALLENKVKELRTTNTEIVNSVREKTHNKILDMEEIIRTTGLNLDTLKREAVRQARRNTRGNSQASAVSSEQNSGGPRGGPYIPVETPGPLGKDLNAKLDHMVILNEIINRLPLKVPVASATRQSGFGRRVDPFNGRLAFHAGLDLAAPLNSRIFATAPGRVTSAGWNGAYGNAIDISHGLGVSTRYGHLSQVRVKPGDIVKTGQLIGIQGSTGRSTGPHVHYEVRYYDKPLNPVNFLNAGYHVSQID